MRVFSRAYLGLIFLVISIIILSGCESLIGAKKVLPASPTQQQPRQLSPLAELENSFGRGDYQKVEVLGQRIIDSASASNQEKSRAATLYSVAAVRSSHPNLALTALEAWRQNDQYADSSREWQEVWCEALAQMPSRDARTKANELYQDSGRKPVVRGIAAVFFAVRQWEDADLGQTMQALEYIYKSAPDTASKAAYEGRLAALLNRASGTAVGLISGSVTEENSSQYPYNIILIDQLRRQSMNAQTRAQAQEALAKIQGTVHLADPSLFQGPPTALEFSAHRQTSYQPAITQQPSTPGLGQNSVALVLPRSGQIGSISEKIIEGASLASREANVDLVIIDSDQPGWMEQLRSLSDNTIAIGGPLRANDYASIKSQGLMSSKAFFAFLPSLEQGDEGRIAWRMFTSPEDQLRSLIKFTSGLGLTKYASLYPNESFGQRMNQLFEAQILSSGGTVKSASYAPNQSDAWLRAAGELLAGGQSSGYQAIFLPDNIRNAERIIPSIQYYDSGKHLILGSSLWEQGLSGAGIHAPENFELAIFPGSWNAAASSPATNRLSTSLGDRADYWSGLGYDFVRLIPALDLKPGWNAQFLNAALSRASHDWSIAPIFWDASGRASQNMFIFKPAPGGGYVPADQNYLKNALK